MGSLDKGIRALGLLILAYLVMPPLYRVLQVLLPLLFMLLGLLVLVKVLLGRFSRL